MITPPEIISLLDKPVSEIFTREARYMYDNVEFLRPRSSIHTQSHCERVLYYALAIGEKIFGPDDTAALEILAHAAIFHDSRRVDDFLDTGHGARAAVYYEQFSREHPASWDGDVHVAHDGVNSSWGGDVHVAPRSAPFPFHPESAIIMRYHDLPDEHGIAAIRRQFGPDAPRVEMLYKIFKDSDALDRRRLGPGGLDPRFLRTDEAREMITFAADLVVATTPPDLLAENDRLISRIMKARKMLLIVDPQVDFISGSLPVPGAAEAMDGLANYVAASAKIYDVIVVTADRHPADHCSFAENGGQWPVHCARGSEGEKIWPSLADALKNCGVPVTMLYKGENSAVDEYSIFANSAGAAEMDRIIKENNIELIDICGLAGDVCVRSTAADIERIYPEIILHRLTQFSPAICKE